MKRTKVAFLEGRLFSS